MKSIYHIKRAGIGLLLLSLCGCASIVDGRTPKVSVNSSPEGARVTITDSDGKEVMNDKTPFVAILKRSRGYFKGAQYNLVFELVGYKRAETKITSSLNGWYVGNIFFGGLIGMLVVDPATGAMWTLHPKMIEQPLDKEQAALIREGKGVLVVLKQQATPNELRAMQPVPGNQ